MLPRSALLAPPLAAAMLIALTACGGPAASPGSAGPTAAAPAGATKPAVSSAAPATPRSIDTCTLLPAAAVSKIMGIAYATTEVRANGDSSECTYHTKGISLEDLIVSIQLTGGKETAHDDTQVIVFEDEKPIPLSGVGDSAYEAPKDSDVRIEKAFGALWGDTYVTVGGPVKISDAQGPRLLTAAHDAL